MLLHPRMPSLLQRKLSPLIYRVFLWLTRNTLKNKLNSIVVFLFVEHWVLIQLATRKSSEFAHSITTENKKLLSSKKKSKFIKLASDIEGPKRAEVIAR